MTNPRNACRPTRPLCERWPVHYDLESDICKADRLRYFAALTPEQRQARLNNIVRFNA